MLKSIISILPLLLFADTVANADQISLTNGDHLTRSILTMDEKKLVLKTIYAGELSIDWQSVDQLTSDHALVVTTVDKKTANGTIKSEAPIMWSLVCKEVRR